jgi:hypothetical protein
MRLLLAHVCMVGETLPARAEDLLAGLLLQQRMIRADAELR